MKVHLLGETDSRLILVLFAHPSIDRSEVNHPLTEHTGDLPE
jgi:hypothetical protein